jgi:hypothetical protein
LVDESIQEAIVGAEYWEYYTPFKQDVATTLEDLRQQEFSAGRFNRSDLRPKTIQQAFSSSGADGTRSILDMERVASSPETGAVSPVPDDRLIEIFGTDRPTRQMVEDAVKSSDNEAMEEMIEEIERGEGRYILLYDDDRPTEVFFCGYSYD